MPLAPRKNITTAGTNAVVQVVESYIQNQNLLGEVAELDELLYDLIDLHKDNEFALKRIVQCIYNLLHNNNRWNVKFGSKPFHKLIAVVIADNTDDGTPHGLHRQLVANVLFCVQTHARKFPRVEGKFLLRQLWSLSLSSERQPYAGQILVQLFDDFLDEMGEECVGSPGLYDVIKNMLVSEERDQRRSAYFLMRKMLMIIQDGTQATEGLRIRVRDSLKCNAQLWSAFVVILETLEEQQSHLILPTLNTLLPCVGANFKDDEWLAWLRILYVRLLGVNNILVLRWTLNYFFNHFDVTKLSRVQLLPEFLAATNRTQLFNVEALFLPAFNMDRFMYKEENNREFLEAFVTVPWHSVPLHFWLTQMQPHITNKHLLLQLSSRVRTMRNAKLRQFCIHRVCELFEVTISNLALGEYMIFVETLYNVYDDYCDFERFVQKIKDCETFDEEVIHFKKRGSEIIINDWIVLGVESTVCELIRHLGKLPNVQHGWWRLVPLAILKSTKTENKQCSLDFYRSHYAIDFEKLQRSETLTLPELQGILLKQLNCQSKEEKSFVLEFCVDYFVIVNVKSWNDLKNRNLQSAELLANGTKTTLDHLAQLLAKSEVRIEDEWNVLSTMTSLVNKYPDNKSTAGWILKYADKYLSIDENEQILKDVIKHSCSNMLKDVKNVSNSFIVEGILSGETSTGDARIEAAYIASQINSSADVTLRDNYIYLANTQSPERVNAICGELLKINQELNVRKPRYFENCKEHRIKIRIARAIFMMKPKLKWSEELWNAVLSPNDQLNISYIYECLVAKLIPSLNELLKRIEMLGSLKPSQQVSMISITHIYCMRNWTTLSTEKLERLVESLLPLTMGAHYQTRLLAQMVLHELAINCEKFGIMLPILNALKSSVEVTLGMKLQELKKEARLLLTEIVAQGDQMSADIILYMTNTPFDEYVQPIINFDDLKAAIEAMRTVFKTRKNPAPVAPESLVETENFNVQRKMNPVNDIFCDNDLVKNSALEDTKELIVVASLIDKLPNLGGLARTCEVLGVKTLILASKSFADKSDFTNLSMTAEKTLNIVEVRPDGVAKYLLEQQSLGYKVVGAEQTSHSVSFTDFKFPEKSVLLLGHEKHGIPVDLIALLDYAVEIPQIGVVRSLNVHVTGSLFIWEYCKQHLQ